MTSEVALMNRLAVALAADSATTVTFWERGERKQRFFKGANKIFNLSNGQPVGLMTFGAGSLQQMPWEVIVKAYRESRGSASQEKLSAYPEDFFDFLCSNPELFPPSYQEDRLVKGVCETAGNIALSILVGRTDVAKEGDLGKKKQLATDRLKGITVAVAGEPFICAECDDLVAEVRNKFRTKILTEFKSGDVAKVAQDFLDIEELIDLSIAAFFKAQWTDLDITGLVIAGYGTSEFFPSLEQYECFGVVLGKVIRRRLDDECQSITFEMTSHIVPIAQDEMVNTFVFGASLRALASIDANFRKGMEEFVAALINAGHLAAGIDLSAVKQNARQTFTDRTREYIWENHATPLRRVVGSLPVDELAELAETLVSIESLKERVTRNTETVSGPIDVAIITKGDGFIWMKRKHYFDPELNIRFVARKHEEIRETGHGKKSGKGRKGTRA